MHSGPESQNGIEHTDTATGLSYDALVSAFERELGLWDTEVKAQLGGPQSPWGEVERQVNRLSGPRGLMVLSKADQESLTLLSGQVKRCSLCLAGNPVLADQMLNVDLRASFLVPFRVCLYENGGPGGAVIAYGRPSSLLASLGRPELGEIGARLDGKIDGVAQARVKADG